MKQAYRNSTLLHALFHLVHFSAFKYKLWWIFRCLFKENTHLIFWTKLLTTTMLECSFSHSTREGRRERRFYGFLHVACNSWSGSLHIQEVELTSFTIGSFMPTPTPFPYAVEWQLVAYEQHSSLLMEPIAGAKQFPSSWKTLAHNPSVDVNWSKTIIQNVINHVSYTVIAAHTTQRRPRSKSEIKEVSNPNGKIQIVIYNKLTFVFLLHFP